jgi:hypothetical protein
MRHLHCLTIILIVVPGCGEKSDPHGRQGLTGSITFQGKPLDGGSIKFLSAENPGQSAGALIRAGKYAIPREQGLAPGTYRVFVSALEATPKSTPTAAPGAQVVEPGRERIPAEYNSATRLTFEVKASQDNKFDITIN